MSAIAADTDSKFLRDYVALAIDVANLRSCVRAARLGKGMDFLNQVLVNGGSVSVRNLAMARGDELGSLFRLGSLSEAAAEGAAKSAPGSGSLTDFERLCDNALMDFLSDGRRVPFGVEPIVGYLFAREAETTAIRTIVSGRMAGLDGNTIRQRLRRTYC
jgi:V/A-type H+-transporting ATPase subunit C